MLPVTLLPWDHIYQDFFHLQMLSWILRRPCSCSSSRHWLAASPCSRSTVSEAYCTGWTSLVIQRGQNSSFLPQGVLRKFSNALLEHCTKNLLYLVLFCPQNPDKGVQQWCFHSEKQLVSPQATEVYRGHCYSTLFTFLFIVFKSWT